MIVLRFIMTALPLASAIVIDCKFKRDVDWLAVDFIYYCNLANDPQITLPNTRVTAVAGEHESSMTNADVRGFSAWNSDHTIHYMPHGLDDVFLTLILIKITDGRIKELHQSDLRAYKNLQRLDLGNNDIAFLEEDLFKHNTRLERISLQRNKITEIHPPVFDHLTQLTSLWLGGNLCIDRYTYGSRQQVLNLIKDVKGKCVPNSLLLENQYEQKLEKMLFNLSKTIEKEIELLRVNLQEQDYKKLVSINETLQREMKVLRLKLSVNKAQNWTSSERRLLRFIAVGH